MLCLGTTPLAAQATKRAVVSAAATDIAPDQLTAVARTVKSVRAEPTTLTLRVGETVTLGKITVTVLDSSGKVRGRLAGYDFGIPPDGPAVAVPRQITGVRPGTTELTVRYPRNSWKERTDPRAEAKIKIVVIP